MVLYLPVISPPSVISPFKLGQGRNSEETQLSNFEHSSFKLCT